MKKIALLLKNNKQIYRMYYIIGSILLRIIGMFLKTDEHIILFNSFGGKKYDDSPKAIYEAMKKDGRFSNYRLIWAFQNPNELCLPNDLEYVRADTAQFFYYALKAKCWITNSSMERGLTFKKPQTLYLNTWHGTPIKKMGTDVKNSAHAFSAPLTTVDVMLAQGQYEIDIFHRVFQIDREKFVKTGLPRNDVLVNYTPEMVCHIKQKLGLPMDKKIILYAPTFREYERDHQRQCTLAIPMDIQCWSEWLSKDYIVLFRAHYEVAAHMNVAQCDLFRDVSSYPSLNDLMIVSDALITDYSSICFDFAIMNKPIYCYAYDYDKYSSERGLYFDLSQEMPLGICSTEQDLLKQIVTIDQAKAINRTQKFRDNYVTVYGDGAKQCCDIILQRIKNGTA